MHTFFDESNDILILRLSTKPVVRDVTQGEHARLRYADDGELVELVVTNARECGALPVERVPTQFIPRSALSAAREFAHARH